MGVDGGPAMCIVIGGCDRNDIGLGSGISQQQSTSVKSIGRSCMSC